MLKIGQIYEDVDGEVFVISNISVDGSHMYVHCLYPNGIILKHSVKGIDSKLSVSKKLLGEYTTWVDAVNSKYFKKI